MSDQLVQITITVPKDLAEFIQKATESGRYLWMISYLNAIIPDQAEHARTLLDFPTGLIMRSIQKHQEDLTEKVIQPMQRGVNYAAIDKSDVSKPASKVISLPTAGIAAQEVKEDDDDDGGSWE